MYFCSVIIWKTRINGKLSFNEQDKSFNYDDADLLNQLNLNTYLYLYYEKSEGSSFVKKEILHPFILFIWIFACIQLFEVQGVQESQGVQTLAYPSYLLNVSWA